MVDTVTTQVRNDGVRNYVATFTNFSDGTGETAVVKVNTSLLRPPAGLTLRFWRISYDVQSGSVRIQWDGTPPMDAVNLSDYGNDHDYSHFGGLTNPLPPGATGNILFTTVGFMAGSSYTITLELKKGV